MEDIPHTADEQLEILQCRYDDLDRRNIRDQKRLNEMSELVRIYNSHRMKLGTNVNMDNSQVIELTVNRIIELTQKGEHMEILEKAIKDDPNIRNEWNKFTLLLRLTGYDGTPNVE